MNNLWDVKNYMNKVKNVVMNYSEMEGKVRDATNNDAWGASSTLMQELSRATHNFEHFSTIMTSIYKRFTESTSSWRNIYKALTLLEYLLKNGSDRTAEWTREQIYELKNLTNFQFVDDKGKDQGINVRQRAKEIIALVQDAERLKQERERAELNRNKYTGVSNESARYGGFGSNSQGSFSNSSPSNNHPAVTSPTSVTSPPPGEKIQVNLAKAAPTPATTTQFTNDLLDFDAPASAPTTTQNAWPGASFTTPAAAPVTSTAPPRGPSVGDFADFQSAAPSSFSAGFSTVANTAPQQQNGFASFSAPSASPAQTNPSFSAFAPISGAQAAPPVSANNFGAFTTAAPTNNGFSAFNATSVNGAHPQNAFAAFSYPQASVVQQTLTPVSATSNKFADIPSNLVRLDGLGQAPREAPKPSMNAIAQQQQQQQVQQPAAFASGSNAFGSFQQQPQPAANPWAAFGQPGQQQQFF